MQNTIQASYGSICVFMCGTGIDEYKHFSVILKIFFVNFTIVLSLPHISDCALI